MNLKSKIFGFAAASVFALSMTTGVMAAEPGGSTAANVDLIEKNSGVCTMSVSDSGIDFGDLKWDGTAWSNNSVDQPINGDVSNGKPRQLCDIQAMSDGVSIQEASPAQGHMLLSIEGVEMNGTDYKTVLADQGTGDFLVSVHLHDATDQDDPGNYRGTINFQVVNAGS